MAIRSPQQAAGRVGLGVVADVIQRLNARSRESRNGKNGVHGRDDLANAVFGGHVLIVPEVEDAIIPPPGEPIDTDVQPKLKVPASGGLRCTLSVGSRSEAAVGGEALLDRLPGRASFGEEAHGVLMDLNKDG